MKSSLLSIECMNSNRLFDAGVKSMAHKSTKNITKALSRQLNSGLPN